jgi:hypothetical protein
MRAFPALLRALITWRTRINQLLYLPAGSIFLDPARWCGVPQLASNAEREERHPGSLNSRRSLTIVLRSYSSTSQFIYL